MFHLSMRQLLLTTALVLPLPAFAQDAALVLGNERYEQLDRVRGADDVLRATDRLEALGFDVASLPGLEMAGIKIDKWGQVQIEPTSGATNNPKVYSGGDCYRGADLVVTAAADGRQAALAIMRKLLT